MGKVLYDYAVSEGSFNKIFAIEPSQSNCWPDEKIDLLIDFSHPKALVKIYEYCRDAGGGIPVVLATTGYGNEEEKLIDMLEKICPVKRSSNFSQGINVMKRLCREAAEKLNGADIRIVESHHTKKLVAPSGTAIALAESMRPVFDTGSKDAVVSLRMGTVPGEHSVYFALEVEVLEIRHTAFSKKIFAAGALLEGLKMVKK